MPEVKGARGRFSHDQIVEQAMRNHESAHAPLAHDGMRPRERPALNRMSVTFWARMEVAGRGTIAAVAAGFLHAVHQSRLSVLIVAVAILCSSANLGTTLKLGTHSVVGGALSVPLAWLVLLLSGLAPTAMRHVAIVATLGVACVGVGYLQLPVVTRKVGLAGGALGVLLHPDGPVTLGGHASHATARPTLATPPHSNPRNATACPTLATPPHA